MIPLLPQCPGPCTYPAGFSKVGRWELNGEQSMDRVNHSIPSRICITFSSQIHPELSCGHSAARRIIDMAKLLLQLLCFTSLLARGSPRSDAAADPTTVLIHHPNGTTTSDGAALLFLRRQGQNCATNNACPAGSFCRAERCPPTSAVAGLPEIPCGKCRPCSQCECHRWARFLRSSLSLSLSLSLYLSIYLSIYISLYLPSSLPSSLPFSLYSLNDESTSN
jgi:hypothetical protein